MVETEPTIDTSDWGYWSARYLPAPHVQTEQHRAHQAQRHFPGFSSGLSADDTISRVHYVRLRELREKELKMPWETPDIRKSYREAFGRDPREDELAGWLNDPETEGKSYE